MARQFVEASSQYAQAPHNVTTNPATSDMTIAAWVRFPVTPSNDRPIVNKRDGWDTGVGFELKNNKDGKIRFDVQGITQARQRAEGTLATLFDGNWHLLIGDRVAGDAINGLVSLYGDNVLLASKVGANNDITSADPLWIAAADTGHPTQVPGRFLDGVIAEVAFFKRVLLPEERTALFLGYSPAFFNPSFHTHLIGNLSPEPDFAGGNLVTLFNAPTKALHKGLIRRWQTPDGLDLKITPVPMSAATASNSTATASLGADVPVSSTVASNTAATATIKKETPLAATMAAVSVGDAALSALLVISGTAATNSTASASLGAEAPLLGTSVTQSGAAGTLSAGVPVQGSVDTVSGASATLTRGRSLSADIDGVSAGLATLLDVDATMSGRAASISSIDGTLNADRFLSGAADSLSGVGAKLNYEAALEGAAANLSSVSGSLQAARPLSSSAPTVSGVQASLTLPVGLAGAVVSTSTASASMPADTGISGLAASTSTATGDLGVDKKLAGVAASVSSAFGRLVFPGEVLTTSTGARVTARDLVGGKITASDPVGGGYRRVKP